ncbi:hypothetical protein MRX96_048389 [Rhipicephalus microplus]
MSAVKEGLYRVRLVSKVLFFLKLLDVRQHHVREHGFKEQVQNFTFDSYKDLCLLKEVVCADPFSNPAAWEDVLRNVMRAINRELTIRGIKERVDLLIGYFRQQDTANLRKSGTEEQYGEREQLLQDVSDLMREVDYAPRTLPRKANGMGLSKKTAWGRDSPLNN